MVTKTASSSTMQKGKSDELELVRVTISISPHTYNAQSIFAMLNMYINHIISVIVQNLNDTCSLLHEGYVYICLYLWIYFKEIYSYNAINNS